MSDNTKTEKSPRSHRFVLVSFYDNCRHYTLPLKSSQIKKAIDLRGNTVIDVIHFSLN